MPETKQIWISDKVQVQILCATGMKDYNLKDVSLKGIAEIMEDDNNLREIRIKRKEDLRDDYPDKFEAAQR